MYSFNIDYHCIFVCAAHALGAGAFDTKEGQKMIGWAKSACVLDGVRLHSISFFANVDPAIDIQKANERKN